jgi:hypothetical protein
MQNFRKADPETVSLQSEHRNTITSPGLRSRDGGSKPYSPQGPQSSRSQSFARPQDKELATASEATSYKVFVRIRPFLASECDPADGSFPLPPIEVKGNEVSFIDLSSGLPRDKFLFDGCFCSITPQQWQQMADLVGLPKESLFDVTPCATQADVYQSCGQPYVDAVMDGYNASILAYGQTSSGKTYTMMGTPQQEGLIPQMAKAIIAESMRRTITGGRVGADTASAASSPRSDEKGLIWREFSLEVSFFEIYNEAVLDLLEPPGIGAKTVAHRKRKVRTHPVFGVYVEGLQYEKITTWAQCLRLLQRGLQLRHTASTRMNESSSRSHAIFQLRIIQSEMTDIGPTQRRSNVYLADLAGSERQKQSNAEGERLKEAAQINLSLTNLRRVVDALIQQSRNANSANTSQTGLGGPNKIVVPYRDSMLTWILSESLGGNAKALMVATLCPHPAYSEETFNTLVYATRAKSIVNTVVRNEDQMAKMIRQLADAMKQASEAALGGGTLGAEQGEDLRASQALVEQLRGEQAELMRTVASTNVKLSEAEHRIRSVEDERNKAASQLKNLTAKNATAAAECEALRKRLQSVEVEKKLAEDKAAALAREVAKWEAQQQEWEKERSELDAELSEVRDQRDGLLDARTQLQSNVALLNASLEEHKVAAAQAIRRTVAGFMPLLRWYQSVLTLTSDTLLSSGRSNLLSQIGSWSCAWAVSAQATLCANITATRRIEATLKDLEVVNAAQDRALTQVAQTYTNVREFIYKTDKGLIDRQWTVPGILNSLSSFCRNAEAVPAVSLRSAIAMQVHNSAHASATPLGALSSSPTPRRRSVSLARSSPSVPHSARTEEQSRSVSRRSAEKKPFS